MRKTLFMMRRYSFWATVVLLTLAPLAQAQEYRAKIQGVVTDASQAVVPGAQVVLLNTQTGISITRETNASGQYLFDLVDPGVYSMVCEHAGFSKFVQDKFTVQVHGDVTVNMALKLGAGERNGDGDDNTRCGAVQLQQHGADGGPAVARGAA